MQPQRGEGIGYQRAHCRGHVPSLGEGWADPIPETTRLSHASTNIGNGQSPNHGIILAAEDQIGIGQIATLIFGIPFEPATKCATREIIGWPSWLPGNKEATAGLTQVDPFAQVYAVRGTQR